VAFRPNPDPQIVTFDTVIPQAGIGLPGNGPGDDGFSSIEKELRAIACTKDPTLDGCDRVETEPPG